MSNRYKPVSDRAKATYGEGEFEAVLSPAEEQDAVSSGHLERVPRRYKVLSDNYTAAGVAQGQTFEATYPVENEAALIFGGHIERVDDKLEPFVPTEPGTVVPALKKKKED